MTYFWRGSELESASVWGTSRRCHKGYHSTCECHRLRLYQSCRFGSCRPGDVACFWPRPWVALASFSYIGAPCPAAALGTTVSVGSRCPQLRQARVSALLGRRRCISQSDPLTGAAPRIRPTPDFLGLLRSLRWSQDLLCAVPRAYV